ncbi:ATP-binding protein [Alteraurantiacibacter buctensis]|uniref:Histidine kinase/HSP90-like ATPase domain-containing protein n=1 Tax=Alteraurantiacibacter buctensis TaxID=1503981 RepID=A0A844YWM7_9SPHN|nr:ATP-binding protein [Alteraurantiacibacter buctensis]MXO71390.1 hypothetical protein [Alteraurantiacibacter buctensis]
MKFDIVGRIQNMRLPDGKTAILYSIYEAVSNSLHSIEDRFGSEAAKKGWIHVSIATDNDGDVDKISITDNGIGFNEENLESFETSDSRHKYVRGGKGVGRFIWIKTFNKIRVDSVTKNGRAKERVRFRFMPEKPNSIAYKRVTSASGEDYETTVELSGLRTEQKGQIRVSSYLKDLCLHFFPQFITGRLPKITIEHGDEEESLNDFIAARVGNVTSQKVSIEIGGVSYGFDFHHLFVSGTMPPGVKNSYMLTGHGRLVGDPISLAAKFDLGSLDGDKAYSLVVTGSYLDERVDQERLSFRMPTEARKLLETAVLKSAESFLEDHLAVVREKQKNTVREILFEHPQLATQVADLDEYVRQISPDMDREKIAQNLFVLLVRDEEEVRREFQKLCDLDNLTEEARERAEQILAEAENQEKHRLAELVVKRHQVLEIANMLLKFEDAEVGTYAKEQAIHDLILPMGKMFKSGDMADHNLWIIDDALAHYGFFASDKPIGAFTDAKDGKKEPDGIFFNPLGFCEEGRQGTITILEFKRPGDERATSDPVDQVLNYIEKLRDSKARGFDGEVIADIGKQTRFECIIVCELTSAVRKKLERSLAQSPTPDGEGYYGWSKEHNAAIRVVSFRKMLRDAEIRNLPLFRRLGLTSPSSRAKMRLARRLAEKDKIRIVD